MNLEDLTGYRLNLQKNYEPKLRRLVEIRTSQFGFSDSDRDLALKSIDSLVWKLTAAGIHLERLWEKRESFDMQQLISKIISGIPEPKRFTEKEVAFLSVVAIEILCKSK